MPSIGLDRLGGGLHQRDLTGEGLEPRPAGHIVLVGEQDDLRVSGRSSEQLEQGQARGGRSPVERVVDDEGERLSARTELAQRVQV